MVLSVEYAAKPLPGRLRRFERGAHPLDGLGRELPHRRGESAVLSGVQPTDDATNVRPNRRESRADDVGRHRPVVNARGPRAERDGHELAQDERATRPFGPVEWTVLGICDREHPGVGHLFQQRPHGGVGRLARVLRHNRRQAGRREFVNVGERVQHRETVFPRLRAVEPTHRQHVGDSGFERPNATDE